MKLNDLQTFFDSNGKVEFKLYSLEYKIEKVDNYVQVYAVDYSTRKSKYSSFKEAINNYKVYNEPLLEQLDRIVIIK